MEFGYVYLTEATNYRYAYVKVRAFAPGDINYTLGPDLRQRDHVKCYLGTPYEVYNGIYEAGIRTANIGLSSANYINDQTVTGFWSPDTWGNFTIADS